MSKSQFQYVPSIDRIKQAFLTIQDTYDEGVPLDSPYEKFVIEQGMFVKNSFHEVSSDWAFMESNDKQELMHKLQKKLMSFQICKDVISHLKKEPNSLEQLQSYFNNKYTKNDIRVVVSWMMYFDTVASLGDNVLHYRDFAETSDEFCSNCDEVLYPIEKVLSEVDIREEKIPVSAYIERVQNGSIILEPDFQRNWVWNLEQQSKFIESMIMNLPIPPIYLKRARDGKYYLIDGLQRTMAIINFLQGAFKLMRLQALPDLNGLDYASLKVSPDFSKLATRITTCKINFYVLQPSVPMKIVYDLFNRINTGGTQLSRQEIRNCICLGNSTALLSELSRHPSFQRAVDMGIPSKRMRDRESILRCIAFRILKFNAFNGSMDDYMEDAMHMLNRMSDVEIDDIRQEFVSVMDLTYSVYGKKNFRLPVGHKRGRISVSVMETIYFVFAEFIHNSICPTHDVLQECFSKLLNNQNYLFACRNSTNGKSKVSDRFRIAKECFNLG